MGRVWNGIVCQHACTKMEMQIECRLLTRDEIEGVLGTKVLFQKCTVDVKALSSGAHRG